MPSAARVREVTKAMGRISAGLGVAAMLMLGACSGDPTISDTGYSGTWLNENPRTGSRIAILKQGDRYLFRWSKLGRTDDFRVSCDWDGRCEEWHSGRKQATYVFTTTTDPASGRIRVDCLETRLRPEVRTLHYVDELLVESGGQTLRSVTIERDGTIYEGGKGPQRTFTKVGDSVADPPQKVRS
jgi:hypothetical protein